jgi:hypothetical protein
MRRPALLLAVTILTLGSPVALFAAESPAPAHAAPTQAAPTPAAAPAEFGTDWDDPRTAAPPIAKPPTRSCAVTIVDHRFAGYDPYRSSYAPPAACPGPWAKVVLRLDGAVKGRQFDRLGALAIGDVTVFKTSTPEPSAEGIRWSVEKDLTGYASLLRDPRPVTMWLGNTVDDTYTGVLDVQVSLTFYVADRRHPAEATATDVLALGAPGRDGPDLTGTLTVPRNTERLLAEVYATGSGGGCEEFWYLTAPGGYSCPADSPYREVQVLLDGRVAGIAAPYPHIYTGGWSNPFLWYVLAAPRAFDIRPLRYDLSPYLGLLTDGAPHRVSVRVVGVPAGQAGWDTPVSFLAWRDPGTTQVTGALLAHHVGESRNDVTTGDHTVTTHTVTTHTVTTHAGHSLDAAGYLRTSHGVLPTALHQRVSNDSVHRWGADENPDALTATWADESWSVVGTEVSHAADRYAIDGSITVSPENRLTTTITVTDAGIGFEDTYRGEASFTLGVPREQRHAVGTSEERYRAGGETRVIRTRNGYVLPG